MHVSFELIDVPVANIDGENLRQIIKKCLQKAGEEKIDDVAISELTDAYELLGHQTIKCLKISDRETTGLQGNYWKALVRETGSSRKEQIGAGGSHGIGKSAPFVVSIPRTIFYWTCWYENNIALEKFQGKSILMSHEMGGEMRQGTGFYGHIEKCKEINGNQADNFFRIIDKYGNPIQGTSILIVGFKDDENWRDHIRENVIENFFYAIDKNILSVTIEPEHDSEELEINSNTMSNFFMNANLEYIALSDEERESPLYTAKALRELYKSDDEDVKQFSYIDQDFGDCQLWIRAAEGLPKKVGFIRKSGMLITTQQPGLIQFRGRKDFIALCVIEDPEGNDLLRRMENVQHDKFEFDRLPEEEREKGKKALGRIVNWIKESLNEVAGKPTGRSISVLSELSAKLPDLVPDDDFDNSNVADDKDREPGFAEQVKIKLKPIRKKANSTLTEEEGEEFDGDGQDQGAEGGGGTENGGGGGDIDGPGEGEGEGGTGTRGGEKGRKTIGLSKIRRVKLDKKSHYRVSFFPETNATASILIREAGDSSLVKQEYISAAEGYSLEQIELKANERCYIDIVSVEPLEDRALHFSAFERQHNEV